MSATFAAIGHVTNDHLAGGVVVAGGSVTYAALAAAHLGLHTRAVTRCGADWVGREAMRAAGVHLEAGADVTTTFANVYQGEERSARVLAVAGRLTAPVSDADIVFACPVIDEVDAAVLAGPFIGASLQGWFRQLGPGGLVERHVPPDLAFLAPCRAVFVSVEDLGAAAPAVVTALRARVPIVVVTDGIRGATVYGPDGELHIPVYPTREVDPTGAGDVFAAACLVALHRGDDVTHAARFGAAAASIVVEDVGPAALPRLTDAAAAARAAKL